VKGMVFDIQKFSIHDGPGIRTTVFLKGCPLKCLWCHNPESQQSGQEISFMPEKCIGCGWCFKNCPQKAHVMEDGKHVLRRELCIRCGKCTEKCYAGANTLIGKEMTVDEVIAEVLKDKPFYETSNGGMTISGGEPMAQFKFTQALLKEAKKHKLHTCLETSGFAASEKFLRIREYVDIFLFDYKESDPARHLEFTGVPLAGIISNLLELDRLGSKIILRCPVIPGCNVTPLHFEGIANLASRLSNLIEVNILPYHPLGKSKSARIGKIYPLENNDFTDMPEEMNWIDTIQSMTQVPVKKG